jgi:hypothetical protein
VELVVGGTGVELSVLPVVKLSLKKFVCARHVIGITAASNTDKIPA